MTDENSQYGALNENLKNNTSALEGFRADLKEFRLDLASVRRETAEGYVGIKEYAANQKAIWTEVNSHKDWITWAQRLLIGALALAVIGIALKTNGSFSL